jgi:transposase-like protein
MTGRPSTFTQEIAASICERLSAGESLRAICRDESMPAQSTVFLWLSKHREFSEQYARARETQADAMAEEILDIADDDSGDRIEANEGAERLNSEFVQRSRLRVDTRKWLMSKLAPKKYGDKITQEQTGEGGGPVRQEVTVRIIDAGADISHPAAASPSDSN